MSETVDQLTVNWEEVDENNVKKLKVKELKKHILSKGAWATVMFLYQEYDKATDDFREPKITIRRYRKRNGQYIYQSKFNISSEDQGMEIARIIQEWYKK